MMTCPDTFYEMRLKGKTPKQIMSVIRGLKQEIGKLKKFMEHPDYKYREWAVHPSEDVQIACNRLYLEKAKQALAEAGGTYIPSAAEQKAINFNNDIPHISKVVFSIGGFFGGYETKTFTVDGDKVHVKAEHTFKPEVVNDEELDSNAFFEELKDLHIGEWRKVYDTHRFGIAVMDGTQWELEIYFSNGRRAAKFHGSNAYPYNFDRLLELFEIENED